MSRLKLNVRRKVDQITKSDMEIFRRGASNATYITDKYMRGPTTGTYWKRIPDTPDPQREAGWIRLADKWLLAGKPDDVLPDLETGINFKVLFDENHDPIFWHHHGWLWLPWQLQMHHARQSEVTVIGGFGCGKTAAIAMSLAVCAMTIPNFRGFAVAPQMIQALEVYKYLTTTCADTPFWDRFVWASPLQPHPQIIIKNSYVGKSVIEILAVEHDPEKVRTLEGDYIVLDQAEKFDDLSELTVNLGSRLRGAVKGRARLGKMVYVANSGDNPELWMRYDRPKGDPEHYLSLNPKSWDNPYLSKLDIENMKRRVGGSDQDIDQFMGGQKPLGRGEHFPPQVVKLCTNEDLNRLMDANINRVGKGLYIKRSHPDTAGLYHWEMPPDHKGGGQYIVVADPGQGNPPGRNSPIIMTWDVSHFPSKPARLQAFNWVWANGSYEPFLVEYERTVKLFRAQTRNAFDSTGTQKGFDELFFTTQKLYATGMSMAGTGKYYALNAAKFFAAKGLMQFPYIPLLSSQLTNYRLPDAKIRQDLVMCFAMSALFMQRYFFIEIPDENEEEEHRPLELPSGTDRYARRGGDRYARSRRNHR